MSRHILVVEDDPHIRLGLREALEAEGYEVSESITGGSAEALVRDREPDLVILDVMLPGKDGYVVCRNLRAAGFSVPILMLTAKGRETDKVVGLKMGADDYVTKPFGLDEVLARVEALLRRATGVVAEARPPLPEEIRFGATIVRPAALHGSREGRAFDLTPRELEVLVHLWHRRGEVATREELLREIWGRSWRGTTRAVDQTVLRLRKKVEADPSEPRHIVTVHGAGYRFEP